ncbi:MAG TPA: hypothetical protein VGF59_03775 [Bryobacteraceae bacterium]|jgi:hypothetical protein
MRIAAALLPFLVLVAPMVAQDTGPRVYKLELTIRDGSDPASRATRHYSMMMDPGGKATLKIGSRVPVVTGAANSAGALVNTQFQYVDVGVNIDASVQQISGGDKVALAADLDLSTIIPPEKGSAAANLNNPIIGQLRTHVSGAVPVGKATNVASVDDPVTMRRFDVEATVTRVN